MWSLIIPVSAHIRAQLEGTGATNKKPPQLSDGCISQMKRTVNTWDTVSPGSLGETRSSRRCCSGPSAWWPAHRCGGRTQPPSFHTAQTQTPGCSRATLLTVAFYGSRWRPSRNLPEEKNGMWCHKCSEINPYVMCVFKHKQLTALNNLKLPHFVLRNKFLFCPSMCYRKLHKFIYNPTLIFSPWQYEEAEYRGLDQTVKEQRPNNISSPGSILCFCLYNNR